MVNESQIEKEVQSRHQKVTVTEDWLTPAGRQRNFPVYEATISNEYLNQTKVMKGKTFAEAQQKINQQLERWHELEVNRRVAEAKQDAKNQAEEKTEEALAAIGSLETILAATLSVDDRIDWNSLAPESAFPQFQFTKQAPVKPVEPKRSFWEFLLPFLKRRRLEDCQKALDEWNREVRAWEAERDEARKKHTEEKARFEERQRRNKETVEKFRDDFESGKPEAIVEYVKAVFERSVYPDCFFREYEVNFDSASETLVVDISLPSQDSIPNAIEFRFDQRSKTFKEKLMKKKEHDELYDSALKQCVLRTAHEVFESAYTSHIKAVVINGWVTSLDRATGNDVTSCVISLSTDKEKFETFNLTQIDPTECIKGLKGLIAGPLSSVAPVRPILQLNKEDSRFVESKEILADYNSETNLAEIPWEDFEHLVRELFESMFNADGAEVKVTQTSSDGGVDAIAFDPDPIRGGKFVIQAKRYTNVVGVSAVRDLYGTMINEGATKGLLVTTSHFGRDSRQFAQDKPITLIDGSNLVYLLEKHGHNVRIDVETARRNRAAT